MSLRSDPSALTAGDYAYVNTGFALLVVAVLCLAFGISVVMRQGDRDDLLLRRLAAHFGVDVDRLLDEEPSDPSTDTGPIPAVVGDDPEPRLEQHVDVAGGLPPAALIGASADGVEHEPSPFTPRPEDAVLYIGDPDRRMVTISVSGSAAATDADREAVRRARTAVWVEAELERIRAAGQASGGDRRRHGKDT